MGVPRDLLADVGRSLGREVDAVRLGSRVSGGSINEAARVDTPDGPVFLKWNGRAPRGFFDAEVGGLAALRRTGTCRVPDVLGSGEVGGHQWLSLEWIPPGHRSAQDERTLGRCLAELHRAEVPWSDGFGWHEDNYIGSLPQTNTPASTWATFWSGRLEGMARQDRVSGRAKGSLLQAVRDAAERLPDILGDAPEADGPSLLHGDLWGGNVLFGLDGPVLIDPAVYVGHREVDLAMTELFGGFSSAFYEGYEEVWPVRPGYEPERRCAYQLYPLLVHVALFGGSYVESALSCARQLVP